MFEHAFEFHELFLVTILDYLYSCRFGTFLFNSERERLQEGNVKQRTTSLWSMINSNLELYKNPLYNPTSHSLDPVPTMRYIRLWKGLYCRWNPSMRPQVSWRIFNSSSIGLEVTLPLCIFLKEAVYQKMRELLAMREQLEKKEEEKKREVKIRTSRPSARLTSPMHVWLDDYWRPRPRICRAPSSPK